MFERKISKHILINVFIFKKLTLNVSSIKLFLIFNIFEDSMPNVTFNEPQMIEI